MTYKLTSLTVFSQPFRSGQRSFTCWWLVWILVIDKLRLRLKPPFSLYMQSVSVDCPYASIYIYLSNPPLLACVDTHWIAPLTILAFHLFMRGIFHCWIIMTIWDNLYMTVTVSFLDYLRHLPEDSDDRDDTVGKED